LGQIRGWLHAPGVAPLLRPELVFYTAIVALLLLYLRFLLVKGEALGRNVAGFIAGFVLASGPTGTSA
jgi:hypothetical protein